MSNVEKLATQETTKKNQQFFFTICVGQHYTQTSTQNVNMRPPTNNWRYKRTEHRSYVEMVYTFIL